MGRMGEWTRSIINQALGRVRALPGQGRALGAALLAQPAARRRLLIVVSACLVGGYALGVLGYVLTTPEVGVRCAFTPVVNYFYSEFLYPEDQEPLREGDRIVQLAGQPVGDWSQLLRKLN